MLVHFRVENFRSLRDRAELSLLVPTWAETRGDVTSSIPSHPETRVGTVAAVFGSNASGKSNLLQALAAIRRAVVASHQRWDPEGGAPHDPFLLDERSLHEPTMFEVTLVLAEDQFRYGFRLDREGIVSEWLFSYPRNRRRVLFTRDRGRDPEFQFGKTLTGQTAVIRELTRPNSLFLSVAAANNHSQLSPIFHWFSRHIQIVEPDDLPLRVNSTARRMSDASAGPRVRELLRLADLGIVDARPIRRGLGEEPESILKDFLERMAKSAGIQGSVDDALERARLTVELDHETDRATSVAIPFARESQGTQSWFALIDPLLHALETGSVLVADELDGSLHPHLSAEVVRMFHDPQVNKSGAQLVFGSQNPTMLGNLLGDPPLRRDEIWITEKDRTGATHLHPLTDFAPRKAENIERGYLQGRYGGVPFVDHERLRQAAD